MMNIAHCRGNFLWYYIPARFGLSDAADMFVFLSGMAASIAFGGTFVRQGMLMGTARIVHRCRQARAQLSGQRRRAGGVVFQPLRLAAHLLHRFLPRPWLDRRPARFEA